MKRYDILTCEQCEGVWRRETKRGRKPKHCPDCLEATCDHCEQYFSRSRHHDQKYCSKRCQYDAQIKGDAHRPRDVPDEYRWCPACDDVKPEDQFDKRGERTRHRRCIPCRRERQRRMGEHERRKQLHRLRAWQESGHLVMSQEAWKRRTRFRDHIDRVLRAVRTYIRTCPRCACRFTTDSVQRIYCSDACCWREQRSRRRARLIEAHVEDVELADIYRRDGGVCQLCGERVDRRCGYPDPRTPVLDHIIPLSRGGTHERKNVQLAHHGCNDRKKTKAVGSQLRMLG